MDADQSVVLTAVPTDDNKENATYIMVPKACSEHVKVTPEGAVNETTVRTTCVYTGSQYYKTSVEWIPRMIPVHHINTLVTDGEELIYKDYVFFTPRMKPRSFSESVYSHPKSVEKQYCTTFTHCNNYKRKWYVTQLEIAPAVRLTISKQQSVQTSPVCNDTHEKEKTELINELLNAIDREIPAM